MDLRELHLKKVDQNGICSQFWLFGLKGEREREREGQGI